MSTLTDTLTVPLGERSYPIYIGSELLADPELLRPHIAGSQAVADRFVSMLDHYICRRDGQIMNTAASERTKEHIDLPRLQSAKGAFRQ